MHVYSVHQSTFEDLFCFSFHGQNKNQITLACLRFIFLDKGSRRYFEFVPIGSPRVPNRKNIFFPVFSKQRSKIFAIFSMPYIYSRSYVYSFGQIFQALRLFPALRLFRSLEYSKFLLRGPNLTPVFGNGTKVKIQGVLCLHFF